MNHSFAHGRIWQSTGFLIVSLAGCLLSCDDGPAGDRTAMEPGTDQVGRRPPGPSAPPGLVDTGTDVGALPAKYYVGASGDFSYVVPLWTPAGRNRIEPDLSLTYSSGGIRIGPRPGLDGARPGRNPTVQPRLLPPGAAGPPALGCRGPLLPQRHAAGPRRGGQRRAWGRIPDRAGHLREGHRPAGRPARSRWSSRSAAARGESTATAARLTPGSRGRR